MKMGTGQPDAQGVKLTESTFPPLSREDHQRSEKANTQSGAHRRSPHTPRKKKKKPKKEPDKATQETTKNQANTQTTNTKTKKREKQNHNKTPTNKQTIISLFGKSIQNVKELEPFLHYTISVHKIFWILIHIIRECLP